MISHRGRGHIGETLSISSSRALYSSSGRGSSGNRGACSKDVRAGADCSGRGSGGGKGGGGGRAGAWSGGPNRGCGALAHPPPERMSSSCLRHWGA